ncbi:TraV family lipoprotein [Methylobacter sp. S3L5C]|uniref:TraV family lipoprotein n=1 Tax=Methylobacter sp. S3L5C TaxID=2839024 RepID=UPI001FAD44E2|nr:TraV family lipoprotein [Methylobacter sp. S3L5C]
MNSRLLNRIIVVLLTALLDGCATQYGCKGMPDDPTCLSTTEAYQLTDKALPEPPKLDATVQPGVTVSKLSPAQRQPVPKIDDPTPIRTPAQVMRIWIAPWEDNEGDLMVSNYVYTELEPRRWMIGKSAPTLSPSLIPLQIEQRPSEKTLEREQTDTEPRNFPPEPLKATNTH